VAGAVTGAETSARDERCGYYRSNALGVTDPFHAIALL